MLSPMHCRRWELFEMVRRFFLVGLFSILNPGSISQLVAATIFCIVFLLVQLQVDARSISDLSAGLCFCSG